MVVGRIVVVVVVLEEAAIKEGDMAMSVEAVVGEIRPVIIKMLHVCLENNKNFSSVFLSFLQKYLWRLLFIHYCLQMALLYEIDRELEM